MNEVPGGKHYEMLWDCAQCGAARLLAHSQRHCPACGAAQDPARRYFPPPGAEIEVAGHRYAGADWACPYCNSPNGAAAGFCANCGGPQDGRREVARVTDPAAPPAVSKAPARTAGAAWGKIALVGLALLLAAWGALFFSKHESTVRLVGNSWAREIRVERFQAVAETAWCTNLPAEAYEVRRTREVRETRRVEDGQSCADKRIDAGDGTFTRKQECVPRYRDEPVHADQCHFRVNRWAPTRTAVARGSATQAPAWPDVELAAGAVAVSTGGWPLGAEREAGRGERFELEFEAADGQRYACAVGPERWHRYALGQEMRVLMRGTGGLVCDALP